MARKPSKPRNFRCSVGGTIPRMTIAGLAIMAPVYGVMFGLLPYLWIRSGGELEGWPIIVLVDVLLLGMAVLIYGMTPRRYELHRKALIVRRRAGTGISYPYAGMERAEIPQQDPFKGTLLAGANGGFLACHGYFEGGRLRSFEAQVTNNKNLIVIYRKKGDPVVLSPDARREFLEALERRICKNKSAAQM